MTAARWFALVVGLFGAALVVLAFVVAWRTDTLAVAVIGTVAGTFVGLLLLGAVTRR